MRLKSSSAIGSKVAGTVFLVLVLILVVTLALLSFVLVDTARAGEDLTAEDISEMEPDEARFAYVDEHGLPPAPAGAAWAEDNTLIYNPEEYWQCSESGPAMDSSFGIEQGAISAELWNHLLDQGWAGDPCDGTGEERIYPPPEDREQRAALEEVRMLRAETTALRLELSAFRQYLADLSSYATSIFNGLFGER